jgi:hypothetical protein
MKRRKGGHVCLMVKFGFRRQVLGASKILFSGKHISSNLNSTLFDIKITCRDICIWSMFGYSQSQVFRILNFD